MKVGEAFPVNIEGIAVARAEIVAVNSEQVELVIPHTRVVMAVKTSIAPAPTPEPETEVVITGVDRGGAIDADLPPVPGDAEQVVVVETPVVETVEEKPATEEVTSEKE